MSLFRQCRDEARRYERRALFGLTRKPEKYRPPRVKATRKPCLSVASMSGKRLQARTSGGLGLRRLLRLIRHHVIVLHTDDGDIEVLLQRAHSFAKGAQAGG